MPGNANSGRATYYLNDGDEPLLELAPDGSLLAADAWGADGLRGRYQGGAASDYLYDPQGSLVQRQTATNYGIGYGAYDQALYEGYGALRSDTRLGPGGGTAVSPRDPAGFGGQFGYYTDTETGLLCLTHRYYDPGTGRFLNRDPAGYGGGVNLYGFAGDNPINEMDPEGFHAQQNWDWEEIEHGAKDLGKVFIRVRRPFGIRTLINPVTLSVGLFFASAKGTADDSTGPNSPYAQQAQQRRAKRLARLSSQLLAGQDVEVGSIRDADTLLIMSLPNAKKAIGAGQIDPDTSPDFSQFRGTNPNGMYHKDYQVDPKTGRIYGHDANNAHGVYKHINIKLPNGKKVLIKITPNY